MKIKGDFIKNLRISVGLTLDQLASRIGYSKTALWQIENLGNGRSEVELLCRLAIFYSIDLKDMVDMDVIEKEFIECRMLNVKYSATS